MGVDPGYARVGLAIIDKKATEENLIFSHCLKTSRSLPFRDRLYCIGSEIGRIIKKYKPDSLAIETLIFNTNQKTVMRVSEARGVVIYVASLSKIPVYEYTPLQIKIAVTGYGRAPKAQVTTMIQKLINIKDLDKPGQKKLDDEYDAIAVGLTHSAHVRHNYPPLT